MKSLQRHTLTNASRLGANNRFDLSSDALFASAFHFAAIGMALVAPSGAWINVNKAFCSIVGYTEEELYGLTFQDITHPEDLEEDLKYVNKMLSGAINTYKMEKRYYHKDGHIVDVLLSVSLVHNPDGTPAFFISQIQDITRNKQLEAELVRIATEDTLTKVHNRRYFFESASREIIRGARFSEPQAVFMIDIDHFKNVNDQYGHEVGDEVLKVMAMKCQKTLREIDIFGRLGGEEFGAFLINTDARMASIIAERVRMNVQQCVAETAKGPIQFTVSIGVATFTGGLQSLAARLNTADQALYKAKESGRNRVVVVNDEDYSSDSAQGLQASFAHLAWSHEYESGNATIDSQHKVLFNLGDSMLSAMIAGQSKENISSIATELAEHVTKHFKDEDAIFRAAGYPLADEHSRIHNTLVHGMKGLLEKFDVGTLSVGELFSFLALDVVSGHLLTEDRKFFPYLQHEE